MKQLVTLVILMVLLIGIDLFTKPSEKEIKAETSKQNHWFLLHRKTNREYFYFGIPGDREKSKLIKTFIVKTGIPSERPTPLPHLVGREYWVIVNKQDQKENPETAPYFLTLNIPAGEEEPFGPTPYLECNGQCNWVLPGDFGLHGTGGDPSKLANDNPGSSGCIRHTDEDIAFLYDLLDPEKEEIRYYIEDV